MEISHIAGAVNRAAPTPAQSAAGATHAASVAPADHVDLSDRALLLSRLRELPDIRSDLVQRVRDAIGRGEYDSPDLVDTAIDRLIEESGSGLDLEA